MIKRLIVNADDYGLSEGVCLGILKAHRDGILTSTTCMMNMENIKKYLEMTKTIKFRLRCSFEYYSRKTFNKCKFC